MEQPPGPTAARRRRRRRRPADALRHDGRAHGRRPRGAPRRGRLPARAQRRRQDDDHRDPRGVPPEVGRERVGPRDPTPRTATRTGAPAPASSCSRGATTRAGPRGACSRTSAPTTRPYATPERPRPYDVEELLEMVGLEPLADRKIATLSGGQRRRLDVAIGVVGRPELLFLDEPTAGFDPEARRDFHELVRRLSQLEDTTILLTTHDLDGGGEARRPDPHPGRRPDRRRRQPGRPRRPDGHGGARAMAPCRAVLRRGHDGRHGVRAHPAGRRRRGDRPRGAAREPGGHLPRDRPAARGRRGVASASLSGARS